MLAGEPSTQVFNTLVSILQKELKDGSWPIQLEAMKALGLVAQHGELLLHLPAPMLMAGTDGLCRLVFDNRMISVVQARLDDGNDDVRQAAQQTLGMVVQHCELLTHMQASSLNSYRWPSWAAT